MVANTFASFDEYIKRCLGDSHAEDALIDAYFEFWMGLKKRVGTASGFTGLSEYLFFRYILMSLEQHTGQLFIPAERTKDTYIFRSSSLMLTHDVNIADFVNVKNQKADIAVFSIEEKNHYHLLACFEIKTYVEDRKKLQKILQDFDYLGLHTEAFLFPIMFNRQYAIELDGFCAKYPGRAFVISKAVFALKIGLDEAVNLILSKHKTLRNSCPNP